MPMRTDLGLFQENLIGLRGSIFCFWLWKTYALKLIRCEGVDFSGRNDPQTDALGPAREYVSRILQRHLGIGRMNRA